MDCSPPHSPVHGIFQVRTLEWVAISYSIVYLGYSLNDEGLCSPANKTSGPKDTENFLMQIHSTNTCWTPPRCQTLPKCCTYSNEQKSRRSLPSWSSYSNKGEKKSQNKKVRELTRWEAERRVFQAEWTGNAEALRLSNIFPLKCVLKLLTPRRGRQVSYPSHSSFNFSTAYSRGLNNYWLNGISEFLSKEKAKKLFPSNESVTSSYPGPCRGYTGFRFTNIVFDHD